MEKGGVWDKEDEELQVLTKSGRLVDGKCSKPTSDSHCRNRKNIMKEFVTFCLMCIWYVLFVALGERK